MKNKIEGITDKIEQVRQGAADSIESAADTVRSTAEHGLGAIDDFAQGTAERLDSTAKIVRNYSPSTSFRKVASDYPGLTVCLGIAVGLFAGLSMRRS